MNRYLPILALALALTLTPAALFAAQSAGDRSDKGSVSRQDATTQTDMGSEKTHKGKKMGRRADREAKNKEFRQKLETMNQRLDQKVAAMNSAQGDQKMAAMSDVINEMVAQRHEFQKMIHASHGKRMMHHQLKEGKMSSVSRDADKMAGSQGMHSRMHGSGESATHESYKSEVSQTSSGDVKGKSDTDSETSKHDDTPQRDSSSSR